VNGARCKDLSDEVRGRAIKNTAHSGSPFDLTVKRSALLIVPSASPLNRNDSGCPPVAKMDCVNDMCGPLLPDGPRRSIPWRGHSSATQHRIGVSLNLATVIPFSEWQDQWNQDDAGKEADHRERHTNAKKVSKTIIAWPTTSVFTGDETGVMNAAEAASATVIAKG
jgi:hypothetical protein